MSRGQRSSSSSAGVGTGVLSAPLHAVGTQWSRSPQRACILQIDAGDGVRPMVGTVGCFQSGTGYGKTATAGCFTGS